MKGYVFVAVLVAAVIIAIVIYQYLLPDFIKLGGYLVPVLIVLSILLFTFIVERLLTITRAQGRGDVGRFTRNLKKAVDGGQLGDAIEVCRKQGGSIANVVGAGLERFHSLSDSDLTNDEKIDETKQAIEEANALEIPLLERNLIALSTIASVSTMVGLLGTTVGMIRSFRAMSNAGAPDATQLALGISEALINTAGGLGIAIIGIIVYNAFTNRIDSFNFMMDEITYEVVQLLERRKGSGKKNA
jgi:biopolymer transport protein ExbB